MCFGAFTYPAPVRRRKRSALPVLCLQAEHPRHAAQPHRQRPLLHGDLFGQRRIGYAAGQGLGLQKGAAGFPVRARCFQAKCGGFGCRPPGVNAYPVQQIQHACAHRAMRDGMHGAARPAVLHLHPAGPEAVHAPVRTNNAAAAQSGCRRPRTPACPNTSTARNGAFFCPFGARRASSRCTASNCSRGTIASWCPRR